MSYKRIGNDSTELGLLAQDVAAVLAEHGFDDSDMVNTSGEYMGVRYNDLLPLLIKAVQQQQEQIGYQQEQITELRRMVEDRQVAAR